MGSAWNDSRTAEQVAQDCEALAGFQEVMARACADRIKALEGGAKHGTRYSSAEAEIRHMRWDVEHHEATAKRWRQHAAKARTAAPEEVPDDES